MFWQYFTARFQVMLALNKKEEGGQKVKSESGTAVGAGVPANLPIVPKLVRTASAAELIAPSKKQKNDDSSNDSFLVKVVRDTKSPAGWELLIGLKEVISKQLPEMPKF
jgi:hypothetical protein